MSLNVERMENYDCVFLGNGATSVAVMDNYLKKSKGTANYLLIAESSDPPGAIIKGVKTVNPIVQKLPFLKMGIRSFKEYQFILNTVQHASAVLEVSFQGTPAFRDKSQTGIRICRSKQELELLKSLNTGFVPNGNHGFAAADFIEEALGRSVNRDLLYAYKEQIWDVESYLQIMTSRIPEASLLRAQRVELPQEVGGKLQITVWMDDGTTKTIMTNKLVVCKGAGNIDFENLLRNRQKDVPQPMAFNVLPFTKLFYDSKELMPDYVSSIMIPDSGICVTNETQTTHSLLYNTNATSISTLQATQGISFSDAAVIHQELKATNPNLPSEYRQALKCAMTIDLNAYKADPSLHFKFIVTPSVMDNLLYLNLPFFSVIGIATQYLPKHLKDLR